MDNSFGTVKLLLKTSVSVALACAIDGCNGAIGVVTLTICDNFAGNDDRDGDNVVVNVLCTLFTGNDCGRRLT